MLHRLSVGTFQLIDALDPTCADWTCTVKHLVTLLDIKGVGDEFQPGAVSWECKLLQVAPSCSWHVDSWLIRTHHDHETPGSGPASNQRFRAPTLHSTTPMLLGQQLLLLCRPHCLIWTWHSKKPCDETQTDSNATYWKSLTKKKSRLNSVQNILGASICKWWKWCENLRACMCVCVCVKRVMTTSLIFHNI